MTTIVTKNGSGAPLASDLVQGELAVDLTNKRLYTEDSGGTVIEVGTSPSTIDINAGTIDGTVIGGASAAAGTFTTFTSTGIDDNATSTAITIDSSQNVGIGGSPVSGSRRLMVKDSGDVRVDIRSGADTNLGAIDFSDTSNTARGQLVYDHNDDSMQFKTLSAERMRIDSSGNLLVGKDTTSGSVTGVGLYNSGLLEVVVDGDVAATLKRLNSDGEILRFRKDGTTVGSIGAYSGYLYIANNNGDGLALQNNSFRPSTATGANQDNVIDLGLLASRFDDIYATNGTIQTSDLNEKQDIEALSEAEQRVAVAAKGLLRKFRWKSAVEEKGDDARVHFGIIAQDLQAAFEAEGLDAGDYGMFIHSTWTDEETGEERSRMGVRYSELLAFIIAAI